MKPTASKIHNATTVDVDALLQDSYLLVVELRHGARPQNSQTLLRICVEQIELVRQQLNLGGMSQRSIDHIGHAQCALLDETVLSFGEGDVHETWVKEPLQAKFFNCHQAGEFLYEDIRGVLREPAPDPHVLTVFQRVLMLGFKGRYREVNDPEREQLLNALSAHVPPLKLGQTLATHRAFGQRNELLRSLRSPQVQALAVGVLLVGAWWGLDHLLDGLIATLLPGQA